MEKILFKLDLLPFILRRISIILWPTGIVRINRTFAARLHRLVLSLWERIRRLVWMLVPRVMWRLRVLWLLAWRLKSYGNRRSPLVSVIIPIYDREDFLRSAIQSVLNQTYKNWELILVTDGSPPATMKIINSFKKDPRIKVYSYLDQSGTAVRGRNRGIKEALGEYIAFLDSDDVALVDRLAISVHEMIQGGYDIVYGAWIARLDGSRSLSGLCNGQTIISPPCNLERLKRVCVPCQSSVMVRKSALIAVGGLKTDMRYREDHELWMRLAYYGYKFGAIPHPLVELRLHAGNNELNFKHDDHYWQMRALQQFVIKAELPSTIAYIIPATRLSGGIYVILEHANRLHRQGFNVLLISMDDSESIPWWSANMVPLIPINTPYRYLLEGIDILVATHWSTVRALDQLPAHRKLYFVQSDERRFDESPEHKKQVQLTYERRDLEYFTMARWIQQWLLQEFGHRSVYVPNGIRSQNFRDARPLESKGEKIRILLEGAINLPFKGMVEAAQVIDDFHDCEVWIVSAYGCPDRHWRYDRFFESIPYEDMAGIYASCDILLKMSCVESFSYPPLEMMATGGCVVMNKVTGIEEYALHEMNCLIVSGVGEAKRALRRLIEDRDLRIRLGEAGRATAESMAWERSMPNLLALFSERGLSCSV